MPNVSTVSQDQLIAASQIFTKPPITAYHQRLNDEAEKLVLADPSLLTRRGELLQLACESAHNSGYVYRKGKSRSSRLGSPDLVTSEKPKRAKIDADM